VTHDDRYFHLADRVVKLDKGAFIELENRYVDSGGAA
jgi:ABC-type siderophore export system fused ATPase/permease subunit